MRPPVEQLTGVRRVAFGAMVIGALGIAYAYGSAYFSAYSSAYSSAVANASVNIATSVPANGTLWHTVAAALAASGPWVMAVSLPVCLMAVMTLGAVRQGDGLGALRWPFAVVFALVSAGFIAALYLPAELPTSHLVLGLPLRAAVIIYGVGILPLFVLPVAYAVTFDRVTLTDRDVAKIRAMAVAMADTHAHPTPDRAVHDGD